MGNSVEGHTDYMHWLGVIASRWADIDERLCIFVANIIGHKNRQAADVIYYTFGSFRGRVDLLKNLASHCIKEKGRRESALKTLQTVERMWKQRNAILHSPYRVDHALTRQEAAALARGAIGGDFTEFNTKYASGVAKKTKVKRHSVRPRSATLYEKRHVPLGELRDHAARLEVLSKDVLRL